MTIHKFYKDGFALVVDLRSTQDKNVSGSGKRFDSSKSGILMEITKRATTADVNCQIFVISDGLVNFMNNDLQNMIYRQVYIVYCE